MLKYIRFIYHKYKNKYVAINCTSSVDIDFNFMKYQIIKPSGVF